MGIRSNAVSPGPIETPIFGKLGMSEEEMGQMAAGIKSMVPLNRFGQSDDIANAVVYLASDDASYVNGAHLLVDGGMAA